MGVADNLTTLKSLRSGIVRSIGVGEGASLQIFYLDVDIEVCVRSKILAWCRVGDDSRHHVGRRGNISHD